MTRPFVLAVTLATLAAAAPAPAAAPQPTAGAPSREHILRVGRRVMEAARFAALATVDAQGRPQVRAMDPLAPDDDMVVWLATNPRSRKVQEIERQPQVALYYFDPATSAYVTLHGKARLVRDPETKKAHWKPEWTEFYPDGHLNALLIEVAPARLEVVSVADGIDTDPVTWRPAAVEFPAVR
jgi:general stress protein 26